MPPNRSKCKPPNVEQPEKVEHQSRRATLTSSTVPEDGVDNVSDLDSLVATPTPRHKGHAFRPEASHYYKLRLRGRYLIDTFSMK
jgi:hypothetical protein